MAGSAHAGAMTLSELVVIAVGFADLEDAMGAEAALRLQLDVDAADIQLRPIGGDPGDQGLTAILGGRFREDRRPDVERVVESFGGRILDILPESWTRPAQEFEPAP